ncbi:unnamed protein product [Durusdinium trenchii]|uniref:Uncharacterized protein n=2 Tax=Durusdinium trenchii TaxID=1381693 RepID=A0ABP0IYZ8_9DINO
MNTQQIGVFLLLLSISGAAEVPKESVTFSLHDYNDLYRRAELKDLQRQVVDERADLQREKKELEDRYLKQQRARVERLEVLPQNWQLLRHKAEGECQLQHGQERAPATYNFIMDFRIFENQWTAIRLIDAQTIVTDWSIQRRPAVSAAELELVTLGLDSFLTVQRRPEVEEAEAWEDHTLVTNVSGVYRISFRAHSQVRSNRQLQTLQLNLLHPITETKLRLGTQQGRIREISVEPSAHWETKEAANVTDMELKLPSTKQLSVKWRIVPRESDDGLGGLEAASPDTQAAQVEASVVHDALHSVDESILQSLHSFKYVLDSEQSLNQIEIHFPGSERITSVVAPGMTTWKTSPLNTTNLEGSKVRISFKSSAISKEVSILVTTELSVAQHGLIRLPTAYCQRVLRQSGTMAVVKLSNIELHQEAAAGVARLGLDQVPLHMSSRAGRPIILAYKFLAAAHAVDLSVIHHEELNTLESVVDTALYKVLVVDGQLMHSLMLQLQNTQRQYMAIQGIAQNATIWTTRVNSMDSKLASQGAALLVPLQAGAGAQAKSSVEIAWVEPLELQRNGTVRLKPPRLDMPMAALSVEVWFPKEYEVNFTTTMRQVETYSQRQPSAVNYKTESHVVEQDFDFASVPRSKNAGVKSKMPTAGSRWRFEQLLVVDGKADLEIAYQQPREVPVSWQKYFGKLWEHVL